MNERGSLVVFEQPWLDVLIAGGAIAVTVIVLYAMRSRKKPIEKRFNFKYQLSKIN